ncbi:hypothetical protein L7F22_039469 [Adiantum nelumboides]|nr:hypothetical protein [Adiantum nelumboides]
MSRSGSRNGIDSNNHDGNDSGGSGRNSPRLSSGAPSKVNKVGGWRAASHIGSVVDDWPMYSSQPEDYILGSPIGFGASSVVFEASFQPLNGRACAVKVIDLEAFGRDLAELRRETQLMSLSKHPNVLRVRGCWVDAAKLHIATRLMNAGSMLDIMRFSFPDGLEEVVIATALKQALEGLNYLHINGWLHRDMKAANLLVDDDGTVLLGDFGVGVYLTEAGKHGGSSNSNGADESNKADSISQAGRKSFVGTPCWMAPEVVERKGYDTKADIWSFGITALELSSGRAPHSRLSAIKILMRTLQDDPPKLDRENGAYKYSKLFDDFIKQCLQKDPSKRPSADKLLQHGFFKQAKTKKHLVNSLLAGLPPLSERQEKRRAMSIASLHNQASWDFGTNGYNSRLTTPAFEVGDPFGNFSGVVSSPHGSVRSNLVKSTDAEYSSLRKSRPPSTDLTGAPLSAGSFAKRQSRSQRMSVSFHFDDPHELQMVDENAQLDKIEDTNQRIGDDSKLEPIKEQKGLTEGGDTTTDATPSLTDGSATSSKANSVDTQVTSKEDPVLIEQPSAALPNLQKPPHKEHVNRLSKLFKRT